MKKLICCILLLVYSVNAFADCDFSKGITAGPNNTHIFTEECYLKVGQLVQDAKVKDQQIADFTKAVQLKDLAIQNSDARVALWQKGADDNLDRLNKLEADRSHSEWLYFALGVGTTFLAGYTASKLAGR